MRLPSFTKSISQYISYSYHMMYSKYRIYYDIDQLLNLFVYEIVIENLFFD